jgi:hypothetical protein
MITYSLALSGINFSIFIKYILIVIVSMTRCYSIHLKK